jgi:hypothetical protein
VDEDAQPSPHDDGAFKFPQHTQVLEGPSRSDLSMDLQLLDQTTAPHMDCDEDQKLEERSGVDSESFNLIEQLKHFPTSTAPVGLEFHPLQSSDVGTSPVNSGLEPLLERFKASTEDALSATIYSVFHTTTKVPVPVIPQKGMVYLEREQGTDFEMLFLIRHFAEVVGPWQVASSEVSESNQG